MSAYADDHCHEDMGDEPCGRPPVGYRIDVTENSPYPVCRTHLRAPYWLTARFELSSTRNALAAVREVNAARRKDSNGS